MAIQIYVNTMVLHCLGETVNSVSERNNTSTNVSNFLFAFFSNNVPNFHARRGADAINIPWGWEEAAALASEVFPCSQPLLMGWWPMTIFQDAVHSGSAESRSWGKGHEKLLHRKKIGKISPKYRLHCWGSMLFISAKDVYATMIIYRLKIIIYTYCNIPCYENPKESH
jgi:hypothetical protein